MGLKDNVKLVENTGGQLKYINSRVVVVSDVGLDINFADTDIFEFENGRLKCNHLEIFNSGPSKCMIGYDTEARLMEWENRSTFNHPIYSGSPFNYISHDGESDSMSFRTLAGTTAELEIIVW